jgi:hypothetical protein
MDSKVKFKLQGHEKFPLREGWLTKGLFQVDNNPKVFQGNDGPDVFGIGNNMVKALRYWLRAFGLITENSARGARVTTLGNIILENDPYFENVFTIWVLHSNIAKNIEEATTWYMFFNRCDAEDLTKEQLVEIISREITKYVEGAKFSENSVKNDLDVLLNMYSKSRKAVDPEEKSTSPFAQLNIVKNVEGHYYKNHPERKIVNEWNVLYELAEMMDNADQMSIENIIEGDKGLIRIYQMTSVLANELLDKVEAMGYIRVDRTAGLDMVYKEKEINTETILRDYYNINR